MILRGNMVEGVQTHVSSVRKGDEDENALHKDDDCLGQTRELTDDAFTVTLCKTGLKECSRSYINGNTYKKEITQVGYLAKNGYFIILYES